MPENYKSALDFYQYDLKKYLEWYMEINNGVKSNLNELNFTWDRKLELDEKLKAFTPKRRNLIEEYEKSRDYQVEKHEKIGCWSRIRKILHNKANN